ncbi:hypothetical protein COCMIDRAFT_10504, partial [Bipolaris oryzae ATCC 44560]
LNENENEKEDNSDENGDEHDSENDKEIVSPDEAEDDTLEQDFDPFLLRDLCTGLPYLTQLRFRFNFYTNTRPNLN